MHFSSLVYSNEIVTKTLNGQNTLSTSVIASLDDEQYIIPPHSRFISADVLRISESIKELFDLIVMDPPWWNKYIRRARKAKESCAYQMMDNFAIRDIPVEQLIKPNALVAIWCTNAPSHIAAIKKEFLPKWNLKLIASWYWIKITRSGEPVCEFSMPLKKQPYEQLFIACHEASDMQRFGGISRERYIFSVPSVIHSHKPPLIGENL